MTHVRGIIVHQTGGATAQSAFNSYKNGANGAHFLIDKDGTIYQTAPLKYQTWHVGKIKARCLSEMRCTATELKLAKKFDPVTTHRREMKKSVPGRYPSNQDSIGTEVVGQTLPLTQLDPDKRTYEALTEKQQVSLKWLIEQLRYTLKVPVTEVFRHPAVSYKNKTEVATASW